MRKLVSGFTIVLSILYSCNQGSNSNQTPDNSASRLVDSLTTLITQCKEQKDSLIARYKSEKDSLTAHYLTQNDSLNEALQDIKIHFKSLEQLSSGEFQYTDTSSSGYDNGYGYNYRIEIYLSEIYKSMYLTKVEYYGEGMQRLASRYRINLEDELNISYEATNNLQFIKWNAPTEFEFSVADRKFDASIVDSTNVQIKEISS